MIRFGGEGVEKRHQIRGGVEMRDHTQRGISRTSEIQPELGRYVKHPAGVATGPLI